MPENFFIDKYNFSRRVVDHRAPFDVNYAINQGPWSKGWRLTTKNIFLGNVSIIGRIGPWYVYASCFVFLSVFEISTYLRNKDPSLESYKLSNPNEMAGPKYVKNFKNQYTNKGEWNHNFSCWSADPYCGKDY